MFKDKVLQARVEDLENMLVSLRKQVAYDVEQKVINQVSYFSRNTEAEIRTLTKANEELKVKLELVMKFLKLGVELNQDVLVSQDRKYK